MPMFVFISGFLVKMEKLTSRSLGNLLSHYIKRMLGWWIVAWCFYTGLSLVKDFDVEKIVTFMIDPYYHLWYVPTLFCMILITYLLRKCINNNRIFWIFLISISILCLFIRWPQISNLNWMIYFVLGVACCNKKFNIVNRGGWLLYIVAIFGIYMYSRQVSLFVNWKLPLSLLLILFWLYPNLKEEKLPHIPILAYWGKHSLQIYLWHVCPIIIMKNLFEDSLILYYSGTFLLLGIFIFYTNHIIHKNIHNEIS